jgi:hypothetical protein
MSEDLSLRNALDQLVPASDEVNEWADVLRRARAAPSVPWRKRLLQPRRRFVLAVAFAVFVLVVGTALAVRLLVGAPAPPKVKQQIGNQLGPPKGLVLATAGRGSGVLADKTFAAGVLQTSVGPVYLWAAPTRSGGYCTMLEVVANDFHGRPNLSGGCPVRPGQKLWAGFPSIRVGAHPRKPVFSVLYGYAGTGVATVTARFRDGRLEQLPIADHFFLVEVPSQQEVVVTARDQQGNTVASLRRSNFEPTRMRPLVFVPVRTLIQTTTFDTHRPIKLILGRGSGGVRCTRLEAPGGTGTGCDARPPKPAEILVSPEQRGAAPHAMLLLWGDVGVRIVRLELRFQDGTTIRLPLTDHYALYEVRPRNFRPGHQPSVLIGRDANGKIIARRPVRE